MKFVGLLSGGKDSCYNIMKCIDYGHELVCLGNLHPPISSINDDNHVNEEMNSYMYQTAGYNMLKYIAICMNKPLLTRELSGRAIQQSLDYHETNNDEVEDLYQLLREIKEQYPDIEGVSCGTIVSSYQRYRVENVCERLGLTPLTYLWQRSRKELLEEMIGRGIDAVLVKVAGAGLVPEKHLGKSLSFLYPTITRLNEKFQLDYCGEGGEYESFVIDCPLFERQRIEITESQVVHDPEDPSVGNLWITECKLVDKEVSQSVPHSLDRSHDCSTISTAPAFTRPPLVSLPCLDGSASSNSCSHELSFDHDGYCQSPLLFPMSSTINSSAESITVESCVLQLKDIFSQFFQMIPSPLTSLSDAVFIHLYISDMSLFETLNQFYCEYFVNTKYPPSRVCVAIPLPPGIFVAMDGIFLSGSSNCMVSGPQTKRREVLHVRSLSEWAPLCIGPYSQANVINESWLYIAGQIPLDPATMKLIHSVAPLRYVNCVEGDHQQIPESLRNDIYMAILNYSNVLVSLDSHMMNCLTGILYLSYANLGHLISDSFDMCCRKYARLCMQDIYLKYLSRSGGRVRTETEEFDSADEDNLKMEDERVENYFLKLPLFSVFVSQLPRNATIEVEFLAVGKTFGDIFVDDRGDPLLSQSYIHHNLFPANRDHPIDAFPQHSLQSPISLMLSMPLWEVAYKYCANKEQPIAKKGANDEVNNPHSSIFEFKAPCPTFMSSIHTNFTNLHSCFALGFSHIGITDSNSASIFDICLALFQDIVKSIVHTKIMDLADLKTIKIFYPNGLCPYVDLRHSCNDAFQYLFASAPNSPPCSIVQVIPTEYQSPPYLEENSKFQYLFSAQFIFINFLQIKSELWISSNQR